MDQKNTIVKCNRSPKCLFEHNGVCDNYVITIGADGSCQEYVETEVLRKTGEAEIRSVMVSPEEVGAALKNLSKKIDAVRSDWNEAATPDICKTCKHNPHGPVCSWKDVAYGIWTCYEEDK